MKSTTFSTISILFLILSRARGHGLMVEPPQRGILSGNKFAPNFKDIIPEAPQDFFAHFPAGDKGTNPGDGKRSQERAGGFNWMPYEPMKKSLNWRAGVCGDLKNGRQDHLRGGSFYFDGRIIRTYRKGGIVRVENSIIAHHNGFIEVHVCDVQKCGGEISEQCFHQGHCYQLKRARNGVCDSGLSKDCSPIDRNYPGRWYLPCTRNPKSGFEVYPAENALFVLPDGLTCEHCVLQWFWTSANNCNPPGVVEYFEGPDGPKGWGKCVGQGGAIGGYTRVQKPCGGREFPEEYYQCADIRITNDAARSGRSKPKYSVNKGVLTPLISGPTSAMKPTPQSMKNNNEKSMRNPDKSTKGEMYEKRYKSGKDAKKNGRKNPIKKIKLFADGHGIRKVLANEEFKDFKYKRVTFRVTLSRPVEKVDFFINGRGVWTEFSPPYYLFGNDKEPFYWPSPIMNQRFSLEVRAGGYSYKVSVKFIR